MRSGWNGCGGSCSNPAASRGSSGPRWCSPGWRFGNGRRPALVAIRREVAARRAEGRVELGEGDLGNVALPDQRPACLGQPEPTRVVLQDLAEQVCQPALVLGDQRVLAGNSPQAFEPPRQAHDRQTPRDRKSTRLNSSHVSISYAVFCLKKK